MKVTYFKTEAAHNAYYYRHIKAKQARNEMVREVLAALFVIPAAVVVLFGFMILF